ncbi:MAG TPA: D-aminoacyl-tRNA deacylase [Mycobacterium sp.]|nr:D-aminoacyl-tRNA deacylase [Mycobacterium sp.]
MRVLVQRVTSARVVVDGAVVGEIRPDGQGLLALVGVTHDDDADTARRMAEKLWQLRILDDERSAADVHAPVLVVSQFTLYANTVKGRRPSLNAAAPRAVAEPLVTAFGDALRHLGAHVETGVFGADMVVELVNDGPVTVLLEL